MAYRDFLELLEHVGKDPSRLIFEDELTGIHNRRFLLSYLEHKVRWDSGVDYPLSLLIIDLDSFKQINDRYGHDTGDQALTWLASVLTEVGGEDALPIRYGGDEFMLLLPKADRRAAREMADRLLQRTSDRPFQLRDGAGSVSIGLSIGFATAPDDATGSEGLFQAADTALLHAKQSGRNQAAGAGEVDPEKVFPKTALYRLKATGIAGRDEEMAVVSSALDGVSGGHSQFLILEAAPGMGKSAFLEEVRRNLAGDDAFCLAKIAGDPQETYRPYYLTGRLLYTLLNQREDRGASLLEGLSKEEIANLSRVLPQLDGDSDPVEADATEKRQGVFATLAEFLPQLVDFRPLILIIDDLHYADEATLLLLSVLIQRQKFTTFICGSSVEFLKLSGEEEATPLERFYAANHSALGIRRHQLGPLDEHDISDYLKRVFSSLRTPADFEAELARITGGSPLFLSEVIRKLVTDRKVTLVGQEWVIEPLEGGYLPRSLEEIVTLKIAELDEEGRDLLARASTLGEDIPLSILAGSAELDENRVHEFLDRAEALGLVSLDFQINDEVMRFLGKRVLEIAYGAIDSDRRQNLHGEVAEYQEGLYQQKLLPSASLLAYHFKRSANREKARRYEQLQLSFNQTVFNPEEAAAYAGELLEDEIIEERLAAGSIAHVPEILRTLASAVRNIQLYPADSTKITQSLDSIRAALTVILDKNEHLHLAQAQRVLLVNGQRLDSSRFSMLADSFIRLMTRSELQGIVFHRGVSAEEIRALAYRLAELKPEEVDQGFWREFALEKGIDRIELRQVRYSRLRRKRGGTVVRAPMGEDEELDAEQLREVPKILRTFLGATQNAKLYSMDSRPVGRSLDQLNDALHGVLNRRQTLTLAAAGDLLLVNGARLDTSGYAPLAKKSLELMRAVALGSVTFASGVSILELAKFVDALRKTLSDGADGEYWDEFALEAGLPHIAFNQRRYALGVVQALLGSVEEPTAVEAERASDTAEAEWTARILEQPSDALRDAVPTFGRELLIKGEHNLLRQLLRRVFEDFQNREIRDRERIVSAYQTLFASLILGLQHKLADLSADYLLAAITHEGEPRVLQAMSTVLHEMAGCAVHFADYTLATRILLGLKTRRTQLDAGDGSDADSLARLLDRRLDPTAQTLLVDDMRSGQTHRQERAAQVLGSLGSASIPLLIDVIKQERDFRVRQLAASLLAESGPGAAPAIKRAVVTEVTVEQRFRVLEVIDTITTELRDELAYSFGDASAKIRRAAFRLFERLHDDRLADLMVPLARDPDAGVAKGAIRSLAHLRSPVAVDALVAILDETADSKVAVACCQALGELGHNSAIPALEKVLAQKKAPLFRPRWDEQVRATAAIALRQISHPRVTEILAAYANDPDARVRQLARPFGRTAPKLIE